MAYFLKKSTLKGRTYISICESFYSHEKKGTAHKTYKSLGSVETHKAKGIADPIAHFQHEVDMLNEAKKEEGVKKITNISPLKYLGYFPLKSIMTRLKVKKYVDFFKLTTNFDFDLFELLSSLIYARSVNPCSKRRTFHDVLPNLFEETNYSYDQMLDGLAFIGHNYEKFVEIFGKQIESTYGTDTSETYFDCTNFYFEIDREDDLRKKGPSKERRTDPIVGLGLLLDKSQIPIDMKIYAGNESEKPVMRDVVDELKARQRVTGKTIHVADKGLNCAQNIAFIKERKDGYLFSKSVLTLPEVERDWVLLDNGFKEKKDNNGKVLYRYKSCVDDFTYKFDYEGKKVTVMFKEKRLLTYNPDLAAKKHYEINRMVEKAKRLTLSAAKKSDFGESAKYVDFTDGKGKKASVAINQDAIDKDLKFAGFNLIVTSEYKMSDDHIYATYHNLWRIEESFRIMKSDLDARPVFLQNPDAIKGHLQICYHTVQLERLLQLRILEDKFSASSIFGFTKTFRVTEAERGFINTSTASELIDTLSDLLGLPLNNYFLSSSQIKSILNCAF